MKKLILATLMLLSTSAYAEKAVLDGKVYCRTIVTGGGFRQPTNKRKHCLMFANGIATDNANTFFGNPPERANYQVTGENVVFGTSEYIISKGGKELVAVKGSVNPGTVLTLQK